MHHHRRIVAALLGAVVLGATSQSAPAQQRYLRISGIYPHLAAFNHDEGQTPTRAHGECGIGAVVIWANRLWYMTYPPHQRRGSQDKLYEVDHGYNVRIRSESVGGTHANRFVHRESRQLIMGPYFIDGDRNVRVADLDKLHGRMTATARHLTDPANKVYFFDMEGTIYEVNVHSLEVTKLFDKPVPGWHGKGAYTAQGRLVIANNGEHASGERSYESLLVGGQAKNDDEAGALAEWDGEQWRIVERRQFTDVTGPGGIYGNVNDTDPVWSMGWDKRSVILKLLDARKWHTFRLPKASHTFDPRHGWFTEWPRIREVQAGEMMMVMHGTMFEFPKGFSAADTAGIRPMATHLRYIPDFCHWDGMVVLAADDTSVMHNAIAGQPQSNLWFGSVSGLKRFGPRSGWGGAWVGDSLVAGDVSDPFLIAGYDQRVLHIATNAKEMVKFEIEIDRAGKGKWEHWKTVEAKPGYTWLVLPGDLRAEWLRLKSGGPCIATAYLHMHSVREAREGEDAIFGALASIDSPHSCTVGLIRPAAHNRSLQLLSTALDAFGKPEPSKYYEVALNEDATGLEFNRPDEDRSEEVARIAAIQSHIEVDEASVIFKDESGARFRLPKGPAAFDKTLPIGPLRDVREVQSERYLANIHGTFYEIPRKSYTGIDVQRIKPVASHDKLIHDFCTWRGLLVMSGVRRDAKADGAPGSAPGSAAAFVHEDQAGLWFGAVDDLWRLGKPVGRGGPWKDTAVLPGAPSDPYLMTGYDRKRLSLSHDGDEMVRFTVEINFDHRYWRRYEVFEVKPGETKVHDFPAGYHAHWLRVTADKGCEATVWLEYE